MTGQAPTLTPTAKRDMVDVLTDALRIVESLPVATPCSTCEHFADGICGHHNAEIPADWLERGCHEHLTIPF